jgi:CheY-like chemotaxis protein
MPHKLLLADDSVTIQRVIELTFADEDVQVVAVGDGKQAIARAQSDRPDIVLADVGMPERDGYEVAAFIKGAPELKHIPVLLLTGAFEPVDEARAQAVGCDGVLVKPFEPQMVINRVKDLLAGRRPQGLWGSAPPPQPATVRPPVAAGGDFDLKTTPQAQAVGASASLEDYFDRLDAAFANLDGGTPPAAAADAPASPAAAFAPPVLPSAAPLRPASPIDDLAGWDPDLPGDPVRPVEAIPPVAERPRAAEPAPAFVPAVVSAPVPAAAPAAAAPLMPVPLTPAPAALQPAAAPPSLADAFAMLLGAERNQPIAPAKVRPGMLSDEVIDDIVRRVAERMNDRAVKEAVVDVAERLVREEIARIKGA